MKNFNTLSEEEILTLLQPLPEPIKEVVYNFYKMAITSQESSFPPDYEAYMEYLKKALPAFTDPLAQKVWHSLVNLKAENIKNNQFSHLRPEMRAQKIAQALLLMENFFEFVQDQYSYAQYRIESEEKIVGLIQQIIDVKKTTLIPSVFDQDDFCKRLIAEKEKINLLIQAVKAQQGDIRGFQTKFMPITRQSKGTGQATLYACFIGMIFKTLYGKPRHADVAILVNSLFKDAKHTATSIASITLRSKKLTDAEINQTLQTTFEYSLRGPVFKNGLNLWVTSVMQKKFYKKHLIS